MKQKKHYAAAGRSLAFECYWEKLRKYLDGKAPKPLKSTNLKQIDCPECWEEIHSMANRLLGK